ncbi:MAG: hypothetical protein ACKOFX_11555, partial [Solirubrobacterales bacterium]
WVNPKAFTYSVSGNYKNVPVYPEGIPPLKSGQAFGGANMLCLDPAPGDLYQPALPNRTTPNN